MVSRWHCTGLPLFFLLSLSASLSLTTSPLRRSLSHNPRSLARSNSDTNRRVQCVALRASLETVNPNRSFTQNTLFGLNPTSNIRSRSASDLLPNSNRCVSYQRRKNATHSPTQSLNARAVEKRKTGGKEKNPPPPLATRSMIAIALPSLSSPLDHSRVETEIFLRRSSSSQTLCLRIARTAKRSSSSILHLPASSLSRSPLSRSSRLTLFNLLN